MTKSNKVISLEKAYSIIHKPILTEKSTNLNQYNQYSFVVSKNSKNLDIKELEKLGIMKTSKDYNTSISDAQMKYIKGVAVLATPFFYPDLLTFY